jgi:hypothetical protein
VFYEVAPGRASTLVRCGRSGLGPPSWTHVPGAMPQMTAEINVGIVCASSPAVRSLGGLCRHASGCSTRPARRACSKILSCPRSSGIGEVRAQRHRCVVDVLRAGGPRGWVGGCRDMGQGAMKARGMAVAASAHIGRSIRTPAREHPSSMRTSARTFLCAFSLACEAGERSAFGIHVLPLS